MKKAMYALLGTIFCNVCAMESDYFKNPILDSTTKMPEIVKFILQKSDQENAQHNESHVKDSIYFPIDLLPEIYRGVLERDLQAKKLRSSKDNTKFIIEIDGLKSITILKIIYDLAVMRRAWKMIGDNFANNDQERFNSCRIILLKYKKFFSDAEFDTLKQLVHLIDYFCFEDDFQDVAAHIYVDYATRKGYAITENLGYFQPNMQNLIKKWQFLLTTEKITRNQGDKGCSFRELLNYRPEAVGIVNRSMDLSCCYLGNIKKMPVQLVMNQYSINQITELNLSGNVISDISGDFFSKFIHLSSINLSDNHLAFIHKNAFSLCYALKKLDISHNQLEEISEEALQGALELEILYAHKNCLKTLGQYIFTNNKKLKTITLAGNQIEQLPEKLFSGNKTLEMCTLQGNKLKDLPSFKEQKGLRILSIDETLMPQEAMGNFPEHVKKALEFVYNNFK